MLKRWVAVAFFALMLLPTDDLSGGAGDSLYGTVTAVRRADLVVFNYGAGEYVIRLIGIEPAKESALANRASQFVANLVLNQKARIRFEYRTPNGEMLSRLFTADTARRIRDVGLELVRAGLARRQGDFDYKYGELAAAEIEAQRARRGLWATTTR